MRATVKVGTSTEPASGGGPTSADPWSRLGNRVAALAGWRRHALAAALGAIATAALPPAHAVPVLIPAFVGLVWLLGGARRPRGAFAAGWWFGFGYHVVGLYWVSFALLTDAARFAWMIPFAVAGLSAVMAVFIGLATLLTRFAGRGGVGGVLVFAAMWTAFEWVKSWALTGFPWNLMATAWVFSDGMIQATAVAGAYGLGLLTVAAAAMPAALAETGAGARRRAAAAVAVAWLAVGLVWAGGAVRLGDAGDDPVPGVRLRLVQPNIPQVLKWQPELRQAHVARQLALSTAPPGGAAPGPTHVIWAESAVPFVLALDSRQRALIGAATPAGGVTITGAPRTTPRGEAPFRVWNSLHAVDERGDIVATYDKAHLVPFGEYVPFRGLIDMAKVTAGGTDFSRGPGRVTLSLPGLPPVSPLICYEIIFPGRVADPANRPSWLLNLTNDGWYGLTAGPYQHFAAARLRAVEEGLPLVRVANTGISAVVDAYGRVVAELGLGREGVVDSDLPRPRPRATPYGRLGDWVVVLLVLVVGGAGRLWPPTRR